MSMLQMLLGATAGAGKTYIEDIFSTQVWPGTSHTVNPRSVVNNLDLSTDGGLVWVKERGGGQSHVLFDTIRGATKALECAGDTAEETQTDGVTAFNTNGFTIGGGGKVNDTGKTYANWSWKKTPGFFDVVSWTGNGSAGRTISHSLGCVPGMIIIKRYDGTGSYIVYHRGTQTANEDDAGSYAAFLDTDGVVDDSSAYFNNTKPTASVFSVGSDSTVNGNSNSYVAYLFAGGESTAATARSVYFTGGNNINTNTDNDFSFGTGDYCIECWCRFDDVASKYTAWTLGDTATGGGMSFTAANSTYRVNDGHTGGIILTKDIQTGGQWTHVAVTRASGTSRFFINGTLVDKSTDQLGDSIGSGSNNKMTIGTQIENGSASDHMKGNISNFRVVKGSAVYTTDFKVPTEPLTNITNTVLLCCNNSSITGSTVTPTTINDSGGTARTESPFDDPAGFIFGEGGDQNIIKTGSFLGGSSTNRDVYLGFEPQWIMMKNLDKSSTDWVMLDSLRGIATGDDDAYTTPNHSSPGETTADVIELTATGFRIKTTNDEFNEANDTIIYTAIRRPDGYVGKPADAGTDVFAMDTGAGSSTIPNFDSVFPVDFSIAKKISQEDDWYTGQRLTGQKGVRTNTSDAEMTHSNWVWDSNLGWQNNLSSDYISWMWKRHAGFDVVTYKGRGGVLAGHPHSLGKIPEMIWVKMRGSSQDWSVYHKGLNGGSSPEGYYILLNTNDAEASSTTRWGNTAPTAYSFFTGGHTGTNYNNYEYVAMLFASVNGISKVGSYTGTGSARTIAGFGFQPRFITIKRVDDSSETSGHWLVFSTIMSWGSGNDGYSKLNDTNRLSNTYPYGAPTSDGFTIESTVATWAEINGDGMEYIYYAHA